MPRPRISFSKKKHKIRKNGIQTNRITRLIYPIFTRTKKSPQAIASVQLCTVMTNPIYWPILAHKHLPVTLSWYLPHPYPKSKSPSQLQLQVTTCNTTYISNENLHTSPINSRSFAYFGPFSFINRPKSLLISFESEHIVPEPDDHKLLLGGGADPMCLVLLLYF